MGLSLDFLNINSLKDILLGFKMFLKNVMNNFVEAGLFVVGRYQLIRNISSTVPQDLARDKLFKKIDVEVRG